MVPRSADDLVQILGRTNSLTVNKNNATIHSRRREAGGGGRVDNKSILFYKYAALEMLNTPADWQT